MCKVPEDIHVHPGNSKGEGGFRISIFLNESMTLKQNFWRGGWGGGFNLKTFHERGMDIFWNKTMYTVHNYINSLYFQPNIGMDFSSKTMYLEDRTVSLHYSGEADN